MTVSGDDRAVVEFHQEGRIILTAVRVDHQTREIRQDRGAVERFGECCREARCADDLRIGGAFLPLPLTCRVLPQ